MSSFDVIILRQWRIFCSAGIIGTLETLVCILAFSHAVNLTASRSEHKPVNAFRTLHRSILLLFAVVVIAIVTLVHFSISKIVAEQSRAQQQSLSPAISLIVSQILKPLHVSEALGKSRELVTLMEKNQLDEAEIFSALERMEQKQALCSKPEPHQSHLPAPAAVAPAAPAAAPRQAGTARSLCLIVRTLHFACACAGCASSSSVASCRFS